MAKQLNVNLGFTADTSQAKIKLQDLQRQLDALMKSTTTSTSGLGLTQDLMQATAAAAELKSMLASATLPSGKLDLGLFNQSLKASGKQLQDYATDLNSLGPAGQKAFANIAKAITTAELPLRRTNGLLSEFAVTLKNTARWQISSSILHGFMGTVQSAYGYAKDLDASLNNIRIVTGKSKDEMAQFAIEANKAAKSLSTTTTAYTDAALIYYQQGLDENAVKERTDVTVKMANVVGEDAQEVSSYMTAIWNNFAEGSDNLEYFGDVMAELGAKTAASSAEIAEGLEKFASIGDTIGLSYEYAASAVATVVDKTRASADTVGTAFKTIFSRLQGLQLGETLDDGTTLNKYSSALKAVGIDIKESNGELKDMDSILDELGAKWNTLHQDEKMALAQTVAGVRQYTQLIALMDNYDAFKENVGFAEDSEGTLDEQAEIYAESWEAASKRVQAAAQGIYQELINDKFFIGLTNLFEKLLTTIHGTIDGLGGLPGVLSLVATMMLKAFGPDISKSLENMFYNLTYNTEAARGELRKLRDDAVAAMKSLGDDSIAGSASIDVFTKQGELQDKLLVKTREMEAAGKALTEEETKRAQLLMDTTDHLGQQVLKAAELRQEQEATTRTITDRLSQESLGQVSDLDQKISKIKDLQVIYTSLSPIIEQCRNEMDKVNDTGDDEAKAQTLKSITNALKEMQRALLETGIDFDSLDKEGKKVIETLFKVDGIDFDTLMKNLAYADDQMNAIGQDAQRNFNALRQELMKVEGADKAGIKKLLDDLKISLSNTGKLTAEQIQQFKNLGIAVDETGKIIEGFKGKTLTFADGLVALGSTLMSLSTVINSIKGLSEIWTDEDLTTGEKLLRTLTTMGMLLPALTTLLNKQNLAKLAGLKIDGKAIVVTLAKIAGVKAEAIAEAKTTSAIWAKIGAQMIANWYYAAAVLAILAVVAVTAILINAYNEEANAAEAAAKKAEELKNAYEETAQAAEDLKQTISDYSSAVEELNKLEKGTLEYKQALIEANEKAIELISNYESLGKWATRNDEGLIVIQQEGLDEILETQLMAVDIAQKKWLKSEVNASQLKEESDLVNFSREYKVSDVENWEDVSKGIVNAIADYLDDNDLTDLIEEDLEKISGWGELSDEVQNHIRDNIDAYTNMGLQLNNANKAQESLTDAYIDAEYRLRHPEAQLGQDGAANTYDLLHSSLYTTQVNRNLSAEKQQEYLDNYKSENWQEYYDSFVAGNPIGGSGAASAYQTYAAYQNLTGMAGIDDAKEYAKLMGYDEDVEFDVGFWEAMGSLVGVGSGGTFNFTKDGQAMESVDSDQLFDVMTDAMAHQYADQYATSETPQILADMTTFMSSLGDLDSESLRNLFASGSTLGTESELSKSAMSQEMAQYIKANWDTVTQAFTGYTEDIGFWSEMGYASYTEYLTAVKKWVDDRAEMTDGQALGTERIGQIQTATNNVEDRVLSGDLTSDNALNDADFNGLVNGAKQLSQMYPELTEEAEILANTNLVGTEMWMSALHQVQQQANAIKFDNLVKESDEIEEKIAGMFEGLDEPAEIEAVLLSEDFETQLDSLLDKNYEIDVEIHAQAEQAFESFTTAAENMRDMASKIGEGYVVAASDIRELNNVFPGIIAGMEDVGDGSVKLNQQVVENAMNSANAEVQASAFSTIEQLENQRNILRAKQASYLAMYEAALVLASGEGDLEEASTTLKTELANIEALNDQEAANTKMDNAEAVATDSNTQAGIMAQNWDSAYQSSAKSAIEFAKTAVAAAKAAQSGEDITYTGDFGVTYQGRNGQSSEAAKLAEFETAINEASNADDYADLAQQFLEAAEAAGAKANDIEGMIAEIGATGIDLKHLIGDIKNGDGPDGPDDDKSSSKEKDDKKSFDFDPNQFKKSDEEIERYHEILNSLEAIGYELENISTAKDRAFGKDKINLMNKEANALKKQIELQKQYQAEIEKNLKADAEVMSKYGASFDGDGNVSNYDEIMQQQVNAYNAAYTAYIASKNAAVQAYNESAKDETADSAYDDAIKKADAAWDAAKQKYEDFQTDLDQYEESVDLFAESKNTLQEMQNQLYDLALEKVEYIVELKIDVAEDSLEYLEYLLEKLDDDAYDAAESMALLGKQAEQAMKKIEAYEEGIKGIFKNHIENGDISEEDVEAFLNGEQSGIDAVSKLSLTEDEVAKLREWKSALLEENQTLMELRQEVRDKVMPAFQELTEEMDLQIEKIEHLQSVTESYRNIIDIVGKDYLGISEDMMGALNQAQVDMAINNLTATKAKLDGMKDARAEAQRALEEATANGDEDLVEFWQETLEEIDGEIRDAEEDYMSSWEDALQEAAETFEESITLSLEKFTDALAGEMESLDALQSEFDRQRKAAERYLPEYKQIYELSKLTRELNKATDETDSVKAKQEYKALLEEINEIEESGREISEYELKQLQAKFDLKQAELALEEAQNAKSQVRMTRDNEGNWGYVYTADQDAIDNAMQNYEDKLYALNDLAYQYAKEQEDALVQLQAEFAEAIAGIEAEMGSDEWYAEVERITAFYTEQNGYHLEQLGLALDDAGLKFTDTAFSALTGFQTAEEYQRTFNKNVGDPTKPGTLLGDITKAYEDWKNNVERAMNAAGTSTDGYADHMMNATEQAVGDSQRLADETVEMSETMGEKFGEVVDGVQEWEEQYGDAIDEMIRKNEELVESLNALLDKMSEVDNYDSGGGSGGGDGSGGGSGDGGGSGGGSGDDGGSGGGGGGGGAAALATEAAEIITGVHTGTIPQTSGGWVPSAQNMGYSAGAISIARKAFNESKDGAGYSYCYEQALKLVGSYDTGGYTGSWGPEGRLALLHQKELVLNAHDTDNMLRMIEYVRELNDVIEINARAFSHGLDSMIQSSGRIHTNDGVLRQEVTIHAEFPDVQDRYEIESAFENLINRASQYANREV